MSIALEVVLGFIGIWFMAVLAVLIVYHFEYFNQNDFRKSMAIILFPLFPIFGILGLKQQAKKDKKE